MRYLIATVFGLAAGVGVLAEAHHIGVSIDALVGLVAAAVDGCVTLLTVYVWGEIAAAHKDLDRILGNNRRHEADQQILEVANAAQVQL